MNDNINIGNKVAIHFNSHPSIIGFVKYMPMATGDSWHITSENGDVYYVNQFDYMLKLSDE